MPDPVCLAIETTGRTAAIALGVGCEDVTVREVARSRRHNLELLPAIDTLFRERGVTRDELRGGVVFVSLGPGSFTGLRVGVAASQMLGVTLGCDLVGVATIDALARNVPEAYRDRPVAVCLAAKRGRAYAAIYRRGQAAAPAASVTLDALLTSDPRPAALLGDAVSDQLAKHAADNAAGVEVLDESLATVRAEAVFELGRRAWRRGDTTPPARLLPIYGREPEAVRLWEARGT